MTWMVWLKDNRLLVVDMWLEEKEKGGKLKCLMEKFLWLYWSPVIYSVGKKETTWYSSELFPMGVSCWVSVILAGALCRTHTYTRTHIGPIHLEKHVPCVHTSVPSSISMYVSSRPSAYATSNRAIRHLYLHLDRTGTDTNNPKLPPILLKRSPPHSEHHFWFFR